MCKLYGHIHTNGQRLVSPLVSFSVLGFYYPAFASLLHYYSLYSLDNQNMIMELDLLDAQMTLTSAAWHHLLY